MKVKVSRTAGFCMGVRRAVNLALDVPHVNPHDVHTLGPLIHNPQVIDMLERRGIAVAHDLPKVGTVVIRSHGVSPVIKKQLKERGLNICDATCPRVARVHGIVKKHHGQGYQIVVFGDPGHAEVDGIVSWAEGEAVVIRGADEIAALELTDKVCLVAQTTQSRQAFEEISRVLRERMGAGAGLVIMDTICNATGERQAEVRRLAAEVEAMVVVGGPESANTRRLAEVAQDCGIPAFLVDNEKDLDREQLSKFRVVGLTAGASTPNWMIRRVYDALTPIGWTASPASVAISIFKWLVMANLFVALAAAALTVTAARIMGTTLLLRELAISFLFVFAAHTLTLLANPKALELNVPARARSFLDHRNRWIGASLAAALVSFILGFSINVTTGLLLFALALVTILYRVRLFRFMWRRRIPIRSLAEVPGSKDIFMAVGWGTLIVLIPLAAGTPEWSDLPGAFAALVIVVGLVFVRALLRDFRDIQADRLIGRETLPMVLGASYTRGLLYGTLVLAALVMIGFTALGAVPAPLGYSLIIPLAYAAACVPLFTRQAIVSGFGAESIIDAVFLIAGLLALLV